MIFKSTIERVSFPNEHFSQKAKAKKKKNLLKLSDLLAQNSSVFFHSKDLEQIFSMNMRKHKLQYFAADQISLRQQTLQASYPSNVPAYFEIFFYSLNSCSLKVHHIFNFSLTNEENFHQTFIFYVRKILSPYWFILVCSFIRELSTVCESL